MTRQTLIKASADTVAPQRPTRTPVTQRNRLSVKNQEPGYTYRIVNDVDDRVERLQELGYELAPKEVVGAVGDKRVDSASSLGSKVHFSVGQGVKAVVMRQKKEWHTEDQAAKQREIDELEATMKGDARKAADYGTIDFSK